MHNQPDRLDTSDAFGKRVGFALVPYRSLINLWETQKPVVDQPENLLSINGERHMVWALQRESAHVGVKSMSQRPFLMASGTEGIKTALCFGPLACCNSQHKLGAEDSLEHPAQFSDENTGLAIFRGRHI